MRIAVTWICVGLITPLIVAEPRQEPEEPTPLAEQTGQPILIDVTVGDRTQITTAVNFRLANVTTFQPIPDLDQNQFRLFEDGVEQDVDYFFSDRVPVSVRVAFQVTETDLVTPSSEAVRWFGEIFQAALAGPEDEIVVTELDGETTLVGGAHELLSDLDRSATHRKKALLLVTDAVRDRDMEDFDRLADAVRRSDVLLYTIAIRLLPSTARPTPPLQLFDPFGGRYRNQILDLAEQTGGVVFVTLGIGSEIQRVAGEVAKLLRNQYVVGYRSSNRDTNGEWREIEIRLDEGPTPEVFAYRRGYFGPG